MPVTHTAHLCVALSLCSLIVDPLSQSSPFLFSKEQQYALPVCLCLPSTWQFQRDTHTDTVGVFYKHGCWGLHLSAFSCTLKITVPWFLICCTCFKFMSLFVHSIKILFSLLDLEALPVFICVAESYFSVCFFGFDSDVCFLSLLLSLIFLLTCLLIKLDLCVCCILWNKISNCDLSIDQK